MSDLKQADSINDLPEVARWVLAHSEHPVLLFYGDMGAGKTTLIKAIASELKVRDDVSSPTFSLVNEYFSPERGVVYHFDFYRITTEEEALDIGLDDYLESGNLCLVEWPDKIRNFLPFEYTAVTITGRGGGRTFEIKNINRS